MAEHKPINEITENQQSPLIYLMEAAVTTQEKEMEIQTSVANIERGLSKGALNEVDYYDVKMNDLVKEMQGLTGSGEATQLKIDNSKYSALQTEASSENQNFNNVVNDGNTMLTSLNQTEAQNLQFCQIVNENQSSMLGLINAWSS